MDDVKIISHAHLFPHWESALPGKLGVKNRAHLRTLRAGLLPGIDFAFVKKRVAYSHSGLEKLRAALTLPPEKTAPEANGTHSEPLPEPVTLCVWKCQLINKKLILAYPADQEPRPENIVRVRVKTAEKFMRFVNGKPMELKARLVQGDLYELATPCPRWKGRW